SWTTLLVTVLALSTTEAAPQNASRGKNSITEAVIRGHMEFLSGHAMKGRGSGTEDEWRAAAYIGSQLRRWGIEPLGDDDGFVQRIENGRPQVVSPPVL